MCTLIGLLELRNVLTRIFGMLGLAISLVFQKLFLMFKKVLESKLVGRIAF